MKVLYKNGVAKKSELITMMKLVAKTLNNLFSDVIKNVDISKCRTFDSRMKKFSQSICYSSDVSDVFRQSIFKLL